MGKQANNDTLLLGRAECCDASKWHHDHPHDTIACNGVLIIGNYVTVNRRWRPWAWEGVEEGAGCVPIT